MMHTNFLIVVLINTILLLYGCSSRNITNSRLSLTPEEQKRLIGAVDRQSNNELYESNLTYVLHPAERTLLKEARLTNSPKLEENYQILIDWYTNEISKHARIQLTNNCSLMVGNFNEEFPLTDDSFPCIGWWLEQKAINRKIGARQDSSRQTQSRIVTLSKKDRLQWHKYKGLEFADALRNTNTLDFHEAIVLAKSALKTGKNCKYKNANAALVFKLEDFLPEPQAYQYIEDIYEKSSACYTPNTKITERLALRIGVMRMMHGDFQLASHALKKSQHAIDPQDGSRSLFWLGAIEYKKNETEKSELENKEKEKNKYWSQLIEDNPFGFFSVIANDKMNRDPMESFVSDDTITLQNRITGGWNENNLQAFLYDLFYAKQEKFALTRLSRSVSNNSIIHKNLYLYWALSHSFAENDRSSVSILSRYFESQEKRRVSLGLLKLNFPTRYSEEILNSTEKVDPLLVLSLIRQESAFDSTAQSSANARGLMQILPSTARTIEKNISANKLYDPQTNIRIGIQYLEKLFERYEGKTECVLAAYNAGANRVDAWTMRASNTSPLLFMEYMPFRETRNYVSTIMRNYYWYKRLMNNKKEDRHAKLFLERNMTSLWKPSSLIATSLDAK